MNYSVKSIPQFDKSLKRLVKKYASLKQEFILLLDTLEKEPQLGIGIGNNCFKIRIAIASKGKGKRGGARVITHFIMKDDTVYLLDIFDKSEQDSILDFEIEKLIQQIIK